jgi:hypothetical protein
VNVACLAKLAAAVAAVVLVGGVSAFALIVHSRPPELTLAQQTKRGAAASPSPGDPLAQVCRQPAVQPTRSSSIAPGLWVVQPGSVVGYRAHEQFAEVTSPHEAVARTERVIGWLLVGGDDASPLVETGCVAVELASLHSVDQLPGFNTADRDSSARDFLNVPEHPYAVFQPFPSPVSPGIDRGGTVRLQLSGVLEVNGTSRPAKFTLDVRIASGQVAVAGSTTVNVQEFGIQVPQTMGDFVAVNPNITLEVSLVLLRP